MNNEFPDRNWVVTSPGGLPRTVSRRLPGGFSLVEVTLALAVISFCLVALLGLLPVGINTIHAADSEAAATNCMEQIAYSIRRATLRPGTTDQYDAAGPFKTPKTPLTWNLGGNTITMPLIKLSASGFPDSSLAEQQFTAYVQIVTPIDASRMDPSKKVASKPGSALISIAWPIQATWDSTSSSWKNSQGSVVTQLIFFPDS